MKYAYDDVTDSILVFAKKPGEQVKGSAVIGNLVVDFTKDGKIVGLEIRKATEFLKSIGIEKSPSQIESATISVGSRREGFVLFLQIKFEGEAERKVPIVIASESPKMVMA